MQKQVDQRQSVSKSCQRIFFRVESHTIDVFYYIMGVHVYLMLRLSTRFEHKMHSTYCVWSWYFLFKYLLPFRSLSSLITWLNTKTYLRIRKVDCSWLRVCHFLCNCSFFDFSGKNELTFQALSIGRVYVQFECWLVLFFLLFLAFFSFLFKISFYIL